MVFHCRRSLLFSARPRLTYITVDKSHNQRFASQQRNLQIGKSKNVPAGLVVDRHVAGVDGRFDFFLTSSQGIQVYFTSI